MKYTIENSEFIAIIESKGAELMQLSSRTTGNDYIWGGAPEIWDSHSPVLFPIVGMLKDGKYSYEGKEYEMPKHGFVRRNTRMELKFQTEDRVVFELLHDEELLKMYPFEFIFQISFQLIGNKLIVSHKIENIGEKEMLFSLGAHPAFKCPMNENEEYSDYYIEFEEEESVSAMLLNGNGLVSEKTTQAIKGDRLALSHDRFEKDVLVFKELESSMVSLRSSKSDSVITVRFADFDYLGIWAKIDGDFVCIEPWNGINDFEGTTGELENKEGVISLGAWSTYQASYSIEVEE